MQYKRRWQDGVGLLFGLMILMLSGLAFARPWLREERVGMPIDLWLIAAPVVPGFSSRHSATLSDIAIELLIVADVLMTPEPGGRARI